MGNHERLVRLLDQQQETLREQWLDQLRRSDAYREELVDGEELHGQCTRLLKLIVEAGQDGGLDEPGGDAWKAVRDELSSIARARAEEGLEPSEVAVFTLLLKKPVFDQLGEAAQQSDARSVMHDVLMMDKVLDNCVLWMSEVFQKRLRQVIKRQESDLLELSTPVMELWDHVLALPLIGTLDSSRAQVVMESLLEKIVETGADVAIIDITGVPTVDTMVAHHLLKAVTAARLMGAACIISGVRPTIAQTMVQLGVDLKDVTTKATLADAFSWALGRQHLYVGSLGDNPPSGTGD